MTIAFIEQQLNNKRPLRIKGLLKKRTETLEEFLIKFFTNYNINKETIYADAKIATLQTQPDKRRSLEDIYLICKYYYPKMSLKQLLEALYENLFESIPRFRSSFCYTINKRVWYQGKESQKSEIHDKDKTDEWGNKWSTYIG